METILVRINVHSRGHEYNSCYVLVAVPRYLLTSNLGLWVLGEEIKSIVKEYFRKCGVLNVSIDVDVIKIRSQR